MMRKHYISFGIFFLLLISINSAIAHPPYRRHKRARPARHHIINLKEAHQAIINKRKLASKLHGLHSHIQDIQAHIHRVKKKENHIHAAIHITKQSVQSSKRRLENISDRINELEIQHFSVMKHKALTKQKLAHRRALLAARIRETYMRGQITYAQTLLQAASVQDLLSRGVYVRQIVRSDTALIGKVQRNLLELERDRRILEDQESAQQRLATEYEQRKSEYLALQQDQMQTLQSAESVRHSEEDELDMLESEAQAMTGRIQFLSSLLDERRVAEESAWRAAHPHASHRELRSAESRFAVAPIWHGELIKPLHGVITSPFGMRYHPILHCWRMHTGVDIAAPTGTPIHAAGDGTVILASYVNGYGYTVIIDHGRGLSTLYAHCSRILVTVGETVRQGQVVALVGQTGLATGPHCHFEVRIHGKPVRPF